MTSPIAGKTVVIAGASSGIGRAAAEAFARGGANLILAARGADALQEVAQICRSLGSPQAIAVRTDVTNLADVRELVSTAKTLTGRIDTWVSNVGVGAVGRFDQTPMAAHARVIEANLVGHMNEAHAVLPTFIDQKRGIFINVISLGAFTGTPFAVAYCASKYGLRGFSESLRAEFANVPGIHICDVYPAFVDTPGVSHGANYVGRKLAAPPPVYDARAVARAIVGLAHNPKPFTVVGRFAQLVRFAHFLAPQMVNGLAAAAMRFYFRRAQKVAVSDGNLFAPPLTAGGIDGGLRAPRPGIDKILITGTAMLCLAALIIANRADRRRQSRPRPSYGRATPGLTSGSRRHVGKER